MFTNALLAVGLTYTTFLGADAPAEPAEQVAFTYQANGAQGWVITQEGIAHNHECVIHLSLEPYRAIVVADSDPMCEAEATNLTVDMGQLGFGKAAQVEDRYGRSSDSAACGTDAQCSQLSWDLGEPYGYGCDESKVADKSRPYGWAA